MARVQSTMATRKALLHLCETECVVMTVAVAIFVYIAVELTRLVASEYWALVDLILLTFATTSATLPFPTPSEEQLAGIRLEGAMWGRILGVTRTNQSPQRSDHCL